MNILLITKRKKVMNELVLVFLNVCSENDSKIIKECIKNKHSEIESMFDNNKIDKFIDECVELIGFNFHDSNFKFNLNDTPFKKKLKDVKYEKLQDELNKYILKIQKETEENYCKILQRLYNNKIIK